MAVLNKYIQSPCSGNSSALLCTTSSARRNSMKHTPVKLENISKVVKYYGRSPDIILKVKSANFDGKLLLKNGKTDFRPSYKRRFGVVATLTEQITPDKGSDHSTTSFTTTYPLRRCVKVDGKITARVDSIIAPQSGMRSAGKLGAALGSNLFRRSKQDYAAQTPFVWAKSPVGGQRLCNVQIDIKDNDPISAIHFVLKRKEDRTGSWGVFCIDEEHAGLLFVLKRKGDSSWINNMGDDFYIPLIGDSSLIPQTNNGYSFPFSDAQILDWASKEQLELGTKKQELERRGLPWASQSESLKGLVSSAETQTTLNIDAKESLDGMAQVAQDGQMEKATDEIVEDQHKLLSIESTASEPEKITFTEKEIGSLEYKNAASILLNKEIKRLVESVSTGNSGSIGSTAIRDKFLQKNEKLAAVAYNSFKDSPPVFTEEPEPEVQVWKPKGKPCSGTGLGNEVLLQGFNWESHHSGRWYCDLSEKATEIASCGFTIVWLPPPTDSVSPEGYMPRDLHNLNSRYGSMEELKKIVKQFHDVGLKVLGDVVLNHRCAQYQNHNGIWNIFGGRLNWDDPHFQGRGNRSSGDSFHAAPNIDHSQEFVRRSVLVTSSQGGGCAGSCASVYRSEIGYDGWRLDFVRGFWGGYVKDYLEGTEPYFAVGEYWDSLSYTYGQMDHNQDAHRQRIVDWINATGGNAGAFDVTTKGILHTGHWRFPAGKEIQGYAYILTHPGTPTVFYDHLFSHNRDGISALVALRKRAGIHCRSVVHIEKAERDVYAAKIDDRVLVKIGPGHYQPPNGSTKWIMATEGQDYKVWEAL